jgi:hypothetical protein
VSGGVNLWKVQLEPSDNGLMRFFIWHINFDDEPKKVGLLLECTGAAAMVTDWKIHEFFGVTTMNNPLAGVGICAAKAQLYGTFIESPGTYAISYPNGGPVLLAEWELPAKSAAGAGQHSLCAAVIECTVASGNLFRLWTAAKRSASGTYPPFGTALQHPANPGTNDIHFRGCWRNADTRWVVTGQMLDATFYCPTPPTDVWDQVESCEKDGPESQYYSKENSVGFSNSLPADQSPTSNPGAYGANLRYTLRALPNDGNPGLVVASLMARGTGQQYFGAARIVNPVLAGERGINKMPPNVGGANVVSLNKALPGEPPVFVPPGVVTPVNIDIAPGGGATLPVTYRLTKLFVSWTGGGGAG